MLAPINPYGRSKLMVEWMLADTVKAHDLAAVVLRYFNVAGADPTGAPRPIDAQRDASHQDRRPGGARPSQRHGRVRDRLCDARRVLHPRLYPGHRSGRGAHAGAGLPPGRRRSSLTCNCGYGRGLSVLEIIDVVKSVSGVDFPVRIAGAPSRRSRPRSSPAPNASARRARLAVPRNIDDVRAIVKQALDWERRLHNRAGA